MSAKVKPARQSFSLLHRLAGSVELLARARKTSVSRVVRELVEAGLDAQAQERRRFFDLADRLTRSTDAGEQQRLKEELASLAFDS